MTKTILILSALLICFYSDAKSNKYYELIKKAEQKIIDEQLDSSIYYYNQAFTEYNYPFVKDIYASTCVAMYANDTTILYKNIEILLLRGLSKDDLNFFYNKLKTDIKIAKFYNDFEYYNKKYIVSLDMNLNKSFRDLDRECQIILQSSSKKTIEFYLDSLSDVYKKLIKKVGYPDEHRTGLGSNIAIGYSTKGYKEKYIKDLIYESIDISRLENTKYKAVYFIYSHTKNVDLGRFETRRGCSFLWHFAIKSDPELDSILLSAVDSLKMAPVFYAGCLERDHMNKIDYAIGWESESLQKYDFDIKKVINSPNAKRINLSREELNIRSLDKDLQLFNAIAKLENLKYKKFFKRKSKEKNPLFNSLFVHLIP